MQTEEPQLKYNPQPEAVKKHYNKTFIEGDYSFSNIINHLLKKPLSVIHTMDEKEGVSWMPILAMTVFSLVLFGFIVGSFQGATEQMWLAPVKIVGGVLFSSLICLPSLYIFCCIGGLDKKFSTILGIQTCTMAITSLLLIGFSPVIWLFSSSSDSMSFFGFLCISIWILCLFMGLKFLTKTGRAFGMTHTKHLYLWAAIFTLVTLQMPTTLRPIIGQSDKILELDEKKFFLQHWSENHDSKYSRETEIQNPEKGRGEDQ
jgi:hypothetical protein